jgi:aminopeptidase N
LGCQPLPASIHGADGIGDPYYPQLGNGGYDVQTYTIVLDVNPESNTVTAKTTVEAKATENLSSLNLDFQGLTVDSVTVNGSKATFARKDTEMTITPSKPLSLGSSFTVEVSYHGTPVPVRSQAIPVDVGWFHAEDGTINVLTEPDGASTWFPNNDHPRDKALYHLDIKVPNPWIVAATGILTKTISEGNSTRYLVDLDEPTASYLVSINIGKYDLVEAQGPNGIHIRNYFPLDYPQNLRENYGKLPEMIEFLANLYGPYPFKEYGVVIGSSQTEICSQGNADETQTLSIHCPQAFMASEVVIVHELAHQWFGDSVSLENWKDVWLKEGFATYAEWLWQSKNNPTDIQKIAEDQLGHDGIGGTIAPIAEPQKFDLYTAASYTGGALALEALRLKVGDDSFFKILKTYAEQYRYSNAGTEEFMTLSEKVSGQNLQSFFQAWLYSDKLPYSLQ